MSDWGGLKEGQGHGIPLPQPHEISGREKEDAMGSYLMMFAAWGFGLPLPFISLIASIIYYYLNKKDSKFVGFHAFQALISQIPIAFLNAGAIFWLLILLIREFKSWQGFLFYIILTVGMNILYLVFSIIGAVKARKGQFYYFYFFGNIAFLRFYGPNAEKKEEKTGPNLPPRGF